MPTQETLWLDLAPAQADFFSAQLAAARQTVFGPVATEAGITLLNASRYGVRIGSEAVRSAVAWPDPYDTLSTCIVLDNPGNTDVRGNSCFTRVSRTQNNTARVEGVAASLGYGVGSHLYGQREVPCDGPMPSFEQQASAKFLADAIAAHAAIRRDAALPLPQARIIGLEGSTTARLFRSLSSLGANLVVAGAMGERDGFSSPTYDLARGLLKVAIDRASKNTTDTDDGILLWGDSGRPVGAAFESQRGLALVRRVRAFPDTIVLTTMGRPRVDDATTFVEQYSVQAGRVFQDLMVVNTDSEATPYGMSGMVNAVGLLDANARPQNAFPVGSEQTAQLQRRITGLLGELSGHTEKIV